MHHLYGLKSGKPKHLAATFDSEQQLQAYVRWAMLQQKPDGTQKFEQGSALVGCYGYESSATLETSDDPEEVPHNPSPSML